MKNMLAKAEWRDSAISYFHYKGTFVHYLPILSTCLLPLKSCALLSFLISPWPGRPALHGLVILTPRQYQIPPFKFQLQLQLREKSSPIPGRSMSGHTYNSGNKNLYRTCYREASNSSESTSQPLTVAVLKKGSLLFQGLWHHVPHSTLPLPNKRKERCCLIGFITELGCLHGVFF